MLMTALRLSEIRKAAIVHPGLWQDFRAVGTITGEHMQLTREDFDRLQAKWFPGGFGTLVHDILAPLVKISDATFGTKLEGCGGCAEREMKLNSKLSHKP